MSDSNVKVVVRVRPFNQREIDLKTRCIVQMKQEATMITNPLPEEERRGKLKDHTFTFDRSYWSFSKDDSHFKSNLDIFNDIGVEILENAWEGFNCSVFAYGQTGSGKSYSMMGLAGDDGLIPRLCESLFSRIEENKGKNTSFKVQVSYMEIYNERIRDLLDPKKKVDKEALKIRTNPSMGPYVEGLSKFAVKSYENILQLMDLGNKSRTVASTNMNDVSSRSHALFTIIFTQTTFDPETGRTTEKSSNLNLVDLAGSERVVKTGAEGDRLKEGASINVSLTALGRVISALAESSKHVPYRDSVLTWLLCQSLGGNSKTFMIAAISPSSDNFEESLSTLRYADRAKLIVNKAVINEDPQSKLVRELKEEIERLRGLLKISGLDGQPSSSQNEDELRERENIIRVEHEKKVGELIDQLKQTEKLMEDANETWEEKLRRSENLLQERTKQLTEMGVAVDFAFDDSMLSSSQTSTHSYLTSLSPSLSSSPSIRLSQMLPSLVNLNEDSHLSECLVYYLKPGKTKIGRGESNASPDIILSGLNIQNEHCEILNNDKNVKIIPYENSIVYVNGELIQKETELFQGDRVILGNNHIFRFTNPLQPIDEEKKKSLTVIDWNFAQKEFAQVQGKLDKILANEPNEEKYSLNEELIKIFQLANEANAISQALNRNTVFAIELITNIPKSGASNDTLTNQTKEIGVRVTSLNTYRWKIWPKDKFMNRLFNMRELWIQSMESDDPNRLKPPPPDEDPFIDSEEPTRLLGIAHVYTKIFKYRAKMNRLVPILDDRGNTVGKLSIQLYPCDPFGNVLSTDESGITKDPNSLLNSHLFYHLRLQIISLVDQEKSQKELELFCRYNYWGHPDYLETEHVKSTSDWNLNYTNVIDFKVTQEFLNDCNSGAIGFEIMEQFTETNATENFGTSSSNNTFDFTVHCDIFELNYDAKWQPVSTKYELIYGETYNKLFRLRHGQQRQICISVCPVYSVTFSDQKSKGVLKPKHCTSLKIGNFREISKEKLETEEIPLSTEDDFIKCTPIISFENDGIMMITSDWLATSHNSTLLLKKTPPGQRILAQIKMQLELENGNSFFVTFEKDICLKVHSRDAEFSPLIESKTTRKLNLAADFKELQDVAKRFSWRFRVSLSGTSPRKFVVGDKVRQAEAIIRAFEAHLESLETSLQLEKYEQELELIQGLNKLAIQENDDTVKEYQSKISQLQDKWKNIQRESLNEIPLPTTLVDEIPKKRSNTITNYSTPQTETVTHEVLYETIQDMENEIEKMKMILLKTKERLFYSNLLSIKMSLGRNRDVQANILATELFDELIKADIPEEFWPQWIQHKILEQTQHFADVGRARSESSASVSTIERGEILRRMSSFWDSVIN